MDILHKKIIINGIILCIFIFAWSHHPFGLMSVILLFSIILYLYLFMNRLYLTHQNIHKNKIWRYVINSLILVLLAIGIDGLGQPGTTWGNISFVIGGIIVPLSLYMNIYFMLHGSRSFLFYNGILTLIIGLYFMYQGWIVGFEPGISMGIGLGEFYARKMILLLSTILTITGLFSIIKYNTFHKK